MLTIRSGHFKAHTQKTRIENLLLALSLDLFLHFKVILKKGGLKWYFCLFFYYHWLISELGSENED
jgi:hypothetical protein